MAGLEIFMPSVGGGEVGPLLLAEVALAFDAADRTIPFGVWAGHR